MQRDLSLILESDQQEDTFMQQPIGQTVTARLLSYRCSEAQIRALPCQDYARIASNREGTSLCFCVCDGVGNSFRGNIAARSLAVYLVDWLQQLAGIPRRPSRLLKELQLQFDQWAREIQGEIQQMEMPDEIPALVREVLEELRGTYGSETVFLCGRIDSREVSSSPFRSQSPQVWALFMWMGNVIAKVCASSGKSIALGDTQNDYHRWSTARGQHGLVKARIFASDSLVRLIVYTDGLEGIEGKLMALSDDELQIEARHLLTLPVNDDVTVLDLQWFQETAGREVEV